jgi:Smg protein
LSTRDASTFPDSLEGSTAFRGYADVEAAKLGVEGRGFLAFLEGAKVLTPLLREIIIERAMALSEDSVSVEKLKVIVLMVLWSQQHSIDSLILEELLSDRAQLLMH